MVLPLTRWVRLSCVLTKYLPFPLTTCHAVITSYVLLFLLIITPEPRLKPSILTVIFLAISLTSNDCKPASTKGCSITITSVTKMQNMPNLFL